MGNAFCCAGSHRHRRHRDYFSSDDSDCSLDDRSRHVLYEDQGMNDTRSLDGLLNDKTFGDLERPSTHSEYLKPNKSLLLHQSVSIITDELTKYQCQAKESWPELE